VKWEKTYRERLLWRGGVSYWCEELAVLYYCAWGGYEKDVVFSHRVFGGYETSGGKYYGEV